MFHVTGWCDRSCDRWQGTGTDHVDCGDRKVPVGRLAAQHDAVGAVQNRVRDIGTLGARGARV